MDRKEALFSFDLLSHTDRTLSEHLDRCYAIGLAVLEYKRIMEALMDKEALVQLFRQLVYFHDFGKATDFFQHRILEATERDNPDYAKRHQAYFDFFAGERQRAVAKRLVEEQVLGSHSKLGAFFQTACYGREDMIEEFLLLEIIRKHHGHLGNFAGEDYSGYHLQGETVSLLEEQLTHLDFSLYNKLLPEGISVRPMDWELVDRKYGDLMLGGIVADQLKEADTLRYFFLQHYLFSLLLSADKGDVMTAKDSGTDLIKPNRMFPLATVDYYKQQEFGGQTPRPIDIKREAAYQDILANTRAHHKEHFFSITLPTGMGKTFSAYNAAIQLQNLSEGRPRIVYCLPFTSVIDQNVQVLEDIFKANGEDLSLISKNHHLSNPKKEYDKNELEDQEGEYLADGWEHDFVVTTFVQLTESIFNNRNKRLRKFHNLTDSIIILDEVQNLPAKYYEAIEETFLKMAEYFGSRFIFVTATQPLLMPHTPVVELTDPAHQKTEAYFRDLNRIQLDKTLLGQPPEKDINYWINLFNRDIAQQPDKSFLFILNTIASSQAVYAILKENYNGEECDFFYLSSSVLPCFRKEIIERIKNSKKRKIVVSTQVVEAGVDIDLDVVYRDFAPLDSINQSAGRCNRNGTNGQGIVKLFHTGKAQVIYDCTNLDITKRVLDKFPDKIPEASLYDLNKNYFNEVKTAIQDDSDASKNIIRCMKHLLLEDLAKEFKLIDKSYPTYNVFIPFREKDITHLDEYKIPSKSPAEVWHAYQQVFVQYTDRFKRKQAIKEMRAELTQYVAKFPASQYCPPAGQEDNVLIYDESWKMHYDLETGFKKSEKAALIF